MSIRRSLLAAEFGFRVLARLLPRHRWRIRRMAQAVRVWGGLIATAVAMHQAQLAELHHSHHTLYRHHLYRRGVYRHDTRAPDPCPWSMERPCPPNPFRY